MLIALYGTAKGHFLRYAPGHFAATMRHFAAANGWKVPQCGEKVVLHKNPIGAILVFCGGSRLESDQSGQSGRASIPNFSCSTPPSSA